MAKSSIVRVQSPEGTKRIEISTNETLTQFYEHVFREFNLLTSSIDQITDTWGLYTDREQKNLVSKNTSTRVDKVIKHGDMIYLLRKTAGQNVSNATDNDTPCVEDEIDIILDRQDGVIHRKKDELL